MRSNLELAFEIAELRMEMNLQRRVEEAHKALGTQYQAAKDSLKESTNDK